MISRTDPMIKQAIGHGGDGEFGGEGKEDG